MPSIIEVEHLCKTYKSGFTALNDVDLSIEEGEILALLGPNGAGKTTLISAICGIVTPTSGSVRVDGYDIIEDYRKTRSMIGLVPQELTLGAFDTVINTTRFSRGLFGKDPDQAFLDSLLKDLTLYDKRDTEVRALSGGMKRRVLIAKALSHEPRILFLDEPTAGVDVELRQDMWAIVERLRESGVTIILTTHYIEEAEAIADRIGIINNGELLLVRDKDSLMHELGKRQLTIELKEPITSLPDFICDSGASLGEEGDTIVYTYDTCSESTGITSLLQNLHEQGISLKDVHSSQSSLEDIFVELLKQRRGGAGK